VRERERERGRESQRHVRRLGERERETEIKREGEGERERKREREKERERSDDHTHTHSPIWSPRERKVPIKAVSQDAYVKQREERTARRDTLVRCVGPRADRVVQRETQPKNGCCSPRPDKNNIIIINYK
jgi:hypothetical protein